MRGETLHQKSQVYFKIKLMKFVLDERAIVSILSLQKNNS